jgi:hypothetical protein
MFAFETSVQAIPRLLPIFVTHDVGELIAMFPLVQFHAQGESAMAVQGRSLDDFQVHRIVSLLARTDMSLNEIAQRMGCSHSMVAAINRKYEVRDYAGHRSHWTVAAHGAWSKAS